MSNDLTPNVALQPHLGKSFKENYRGDMNFAGYLALAKVIKVHNKNNTADVQIIKTNDTITSNDINQGKYAARIGVTTAHFDKKSMTSSGVVEPIQDGQLVLISFIDGYKKQPVILLSFHDTWDSINNILTTRYPLKTDELTGYRDALKYLRVFPSQLYHRVDGIGGVEISYPSKSFIKIDPDLENSIDDRHNGFDHDSLIEKHPSTFRTLSGVIEESRLPLKFLFVHRSSPNTSNLSWTKFFINSDGTFRFTRDNNDNTLSYLQMDANGSILFRRQLDSDTLNSGDNTSEMSIGADGQCTIFRKVNGIESSVKISLIGEISIKHGDNIISLNNDNTMRLGHHTGSYITFDENGDINIRANRYVNITQQPH